jgi:hypothetical protein
MVVEARRRQDQLGSFSGIHDRFAQQIILFHFLAWPHASGLFKYQQEINTSPLSRNPGANGCPEDYLYEFSSDGR